jgi:TonB-linked SusC/RagA family outer membrane protein
VFRSIRQQTGYMFIYNDQQLQKANKVTIDVKNAALQQVLQQCFANQPLTYSIQEKVIIVSPRDERSLDLRGVVTDEDGKPIPGVAVTIKGSTKGTSTNDRGEYVLNNVDEKAVLSFSFIGYEAQTVSLKGRTQLSVTLKTDIKVLDETVIVGYGTTTRRFNTGAVSTVSASEIARQPVANPLIALEGRIPGMVVTQSNGLPGGRVNIQIRGINTISSGALPLYIIDGVPFTMLNGSQPASDNLNDYGLYAANSGISPFNSINPADIERIDVLKDADATAIYGSRGANGVVLITTKKGKTGKTKVELNVYKGVGVVGRKIPMLGLKDYLALRREAFKNDNVTPTAANAPDLISWDTTRATDWQDYLLGGSANISDAQVTLSGGDVKTHFTLAGGYHQEGTVYPGNMGDKRGSVRLNLEHTSLDKRFYALISASYSAGKTTLPSVDLASYYNLPPNYPIYKADGSLNWIGNFDNPIGLLRRKYTGITNNLISNAMVRYTILPGLNIKSSFGYTTISNDQKMAFPAASQNNATSTPTSYARFANNGVKSWIVEPQLEYNRKVSKGGLQALVGMTFQQNLAQGYSISGNNYTNDALLGSMSGAGTLTTSYNNYDLYKYTSFFARLNYNWDGKYIINGTFRRDGSSRFGPNNRFGNFGAIGAAWLFTQEDFMKSLSWLSSGKLRASYGLTGNDQISNYQYLSTYSSSSGYTFLGAAVLYPSRLANPDYSWETTRKAEAALEFGLAEDRVLFTASYYRNLSGNQLLYIATPAQVGTTGYTGNFPAEIRNTGVELTLNTVNFKRKDFSWTTSINITLPKNELVKFPGLNTSTSYMYSYLIGYPVNIIQRYQYKGVNPLTGLPGYYSVTGDSTTANPQFATDRLPQKVGTPYYGGIGNNLSYKNWSFDFFFQFVHQYGNNNTITTPVGSMINQNTSVNDRWQQKGDNATFPVATTTAGTPSYTAYTSWFTSSNVFRGDASYLKLRNVALSYSFPSDWTRRVKMERLRLYAQAQNVFTLAKNKYVLDPENATVVNQASVVMPALRTVTFGLNCVF